MYRFINQKHEGERLEFEWLIRGKGFEIKKRG